MRDFVKWNLSASGRKMKASDVFFVSFPKSGRTWVRVFYCAYLSKLTDREFSLNAPQLPGIPKVVFTHDRWEHRVLPGWWNYVRGRHLVPPSARREKKIVLLVRDPRDVALSLYFHLTKRSHSFKWEPQPISDMLRDGRFGINPMVELMNEWLMEWHGSPRFKLMRYADCRQNPGREFREFLTFVGMTEIDETAFEHALHFSSFENMQAMEASGTFDATVLTPGNREDLNSFKVRSGKVGGFREAFGATDLEFAAEAMKRLDPRFGYTP